jgi:MYXO-CTERM domain-containing protein
VFFARACDTAKFNFIFDRYEDIDGNLPPGTGGWDDPRPEPRPLQPGGVDNESMAEAMLVSGLTGAVGYVGAHSGIHEAGIPISQKFFASWDAGYHRMGDMWNQAVAGFADDHLYSGHWMGTSPYQSHHIHKFLLFGDPSLRVGGIPEEDLADLYNGETNPDELQAGIQTLLSREAPDFRGLSYPRYTRGEAVSLTGETQGHGLVRLYEGRQLLSEVRADDSGRFRMELPRLEEGNHTLTLALEGLDRPGGEETLRIGVYHAAPEARNVAVCDVCGPRDVLVTGETQYDGTTVELLEDGRTVGIVNSRHGGRFEIRTSSVLDDGEHGFILRLRDAAGNVTELPGTIPVTIACQGDGCAPACDDGLTDCAGACVDLSSDDANCGACAIACDDGQSCQDGACRDDCGDDCGTDPDIAPEPSSGCSTTSPASGAWLIPLLALVLLGLRPRRN